LPSLRRALHRWSPRPPLLMLIPYATLFRSCLLTVYLYPSAVVRSAHELMMLCVPLDWTAQISAAKCPHRCCRGRDSYLDADISRSEEHTSELQSREKLVCRLLLERKN